MSISNEELLLQIRERAEKDGRRTGQPAHGTASETVSRELRSPDGSARRAEDTDGGSVREDTFGTHSAARNAETLRGYDLTGGSNESESAPIGGRVDSGRGGAERDAQSKDRIEKPSGLAIAPSTRERQIRREQEAVAAAAEQKPGRRGYKEKIAAVAAKFKPEPQPIILATAKKDKKDDSGEGPLGFLHVEPRAKPFSEKEAEAYREQLQGALLDYFELLDKLMTATTRGHLSCTIWQSIDNEECGILVEWRLAKARTDARAATIVVAIVQAHQHLKVGIILGPRFLDTINFYVSNGFSLK
jgi:hypothetical protein